MGWIFDPSLNLREGEGVSYINSFILAAREEMGMVSWARVKESRIQMLRPVISGPVNHRVEIHSFSGFFRSYMNIDIDQALSSVDWLTLPQQKLRSIIAGRVFHDDLGLESNPSRFAGIPMTSGSIFWLHCGNVSVRTNT